MIFLKIKRFCLTLTEGARLWYATLNIQQQQLNWEGLQDRFRQQYSKFGNTREQYFHVWRSFQFDEATNMIDEYLQKVKQVAALLDYGDPQILEWFKNTLPSRLYYMLYQINDLREAVETAKRLLMMEQMDKKAGQSCASPFMQVNQNGSKNKDKTKKKVSFSAVEAVERTTDSIERLASLMDKMDTNLTEEKTKIGPGFIKVEVGDVVIDKITMVPETDHVVETDIKTIIGEEETTAIVVVIEIIGLIIERIAGQERGIITEMAIGIPIVQLTEGKTVVKDMVIGTKTMADLGTETEIGGIGVAPGKALNPEAVPKIDTKTEGRVEVIPEMETGLNLDLDPLLM